MDKQELQVMIRFKVEHNPGDQEHLEQVLRRYFAGKGVEYADKVITI